MGSPSVVMGLVLGQDHPQMPFAEDEHPVGDLCPDREHKPFRVAVRAGHRAVPWKKSAASIVDAWVCRNFRQLASVCLTGAGGIFRALRTPADRGCADPVAELE